MDIEINFLNLGIPGPYGEAGLLPYPSIDMNDEYTWGYDANDSGKSSILADS